ncbi:vacuolar transporter [beta proteobacterium AAP121]|nr:vacuolar transporter [beta proteobacterium AAP65]KPF95177.1 vacuolar transporter [beta proteobacterium AAP121]
MFSTASVEKELGMTPIPDTTDEWLTGGFAPIGLQALNQKAAMLERLDNKYVVQASALHAALPELMTLFDVLEIDGKRSFTYDTCYFDDPQRRSYHDHHQGRRQRLKVRVRHYVDAALCFVEVKLKDKRGSTVKKRMPYDPGKYGRLDASALAHVDAACRAVYGRPFNLPLEPVLHMRYRRVTLVAREGGERMTIDTGITFFGSGQEGTDAGQRRTGDSVFIVETKSAHGHGLADAVLRRYHQHPTNACSKYCVGMSLTGEVQRFNRFLPALRKLGEMPSRAPA